MSFTTNGGAFTGKRTNMVIHADGSAEVNLDYTDTATGAMVATRTIYVPANTSNPIVDQNGKIINSTVPTALATDTTNYTSEVDSILSSGASAGKLDI